MALIKIPETGNEYITISSYYETHFLIGRYSEKLKAVWYTVWEMYLPNGRVRTRSRACMITHGDPDFVRRTFSSYHCIDERLNVPKGL